MPITGQTLLSNTCTLLPDNGAPAPEHMKLESVSIPATREQGILTRVCIYLYFILLISRAHLQISADFLTVGFCCLCNTPIQNLTIKNSIIFGRMGGMQGLNQEPFDTNWWRRYKSRLISPISALTFTYTQSHSYYCFS